MHSNFDRHMDLQNTSYYTYNEDVKLSNKFIILYLFAWSEMSALNLLEK